MKGAGVFVVTRLLADIAAKGQQIIDPHTQQAGLAGRNNRAAVALLPQFARGTQLCRRKTQCELSLAGRLQW